jgi:hypothetical protein
MSEVNRIVGDAPCPMCDTLVKVKLTKKNLLYYICDHTDGGCGHQLLCRDPAAEKHLARRITKWVKREDRLAYLGNEALPAKAKPAPRPEPIEPEDELEEQPEENEPEPEPEPTPQPAPRAKRPLPPALKARQFKAGERKRSGGFLGMFEDE